MLRGANSINLDSKGRLAMPTRYRDWLSEECQGQMVCTVDINLNCLLLYPLNEWEEIERKLRKLSSMNPAERRLQRLLLGYADDCQMDKNGRLLISAPLRQHAGLEKQVMLVGQLNKFEIWSDQNWNDQIESDLNVSDDDEFLSDQLRDFSL
ncbi:division/cell wall cluster transcriptional repressor MraZ [Celerinatantimonas diazotrophica]|jgi:MraZ protein|uniref:Transcriptional regulator MraZ n=1 Tax=Celerinatantimonas diazotrophica TaxID=412034 RepID=A0A4R1K1U0_9GAMM|nr:division/cell wall cluster transcriptional repressor MraZ [Celerinatantimonas diazotrophica]TCK57955.1 MraZ protein [Celerinatantimonas diazotrophica]CAG9297976.1 Transcriptional regulator MraZ [Celerinatantimonas diazotrophica]